MKGQYNFLIKTLQVFLGHILRLRFITFLKSMPELRFNKIKYINFRIKESFMFTNKVCNYSITLAHKYFIVLFGAQKACLLC